MWRGSCCLSEKLIEIEEIEYTIRWNLNLMLIYNSRFRFVWWNHMNIIIWQYQNLKMYPKLIVVNIDSQQSIILWGFEILWEHQKCWKWIINLNTINSNDSPYSIYLRRFIQSLFLKRRMQRQNIYRKKYSYLRKIFILLSTHDEEIV